MPIPNFLLIGAQKCGTTALYAALRQHPDIYMSPNKEPFFFIMDGKLPAYAMPGPRYTDRLVYDWDAYCHLFAGANGQQAIGEASAIYLSSYYPERTAERIYQRIPDARLIAMVRQPAERAYSAHTFYHARGLEPLADFAQALAAEPARVQSGAMPDLRYRLNGCYYANLKPYFDRFPRQQIRVYLYEEWNQRPQAVLRDIFAFLGVDATIDIEPKRKNVTMQPRWSWLHRFLDQPNQTRQMLETILRGRLRTRVYGKLRSYNRRLPPVLAPELRQTLTQRYSSDIEQLQTLIGRDLSHWMVA